MANIYGNAIDLENARKILGNTPGLNFVDTSKGGTYTPTSSDYVVGGTGAVGGLADAGQAQRLAGLDSKGTYDAIQGAAGGIMRGSYANEMMNYQNQLLEAQQAQKQAALRTAMENNTQSLNSQKSTVNNAYSKAVNSINATKEAQLPQYQQQRNAASADAAQAARKVRELMAATGRYNSGTNRSQQMAVELNRQNAIQGLNQGENQFTTQIANQLSDVENQKASSISDIASKLALLQRQYNDGTLDLNNQMASEKAAAASKAMLDAQAWADATQQRGIDNSARQAQFDYQKQLDSWNQAFQQKQYDNGLNMDIAQLMGSYNGAPTLAAQQLALSAQKAYSGGGSGTNQSLSDIKYQDEVGSKQSFAQAMQGLQTMASNGSTRSEILKFINSNAGDLQANGVPVQDLYNWATKNFTWDKKNGEWYDTVE
jgi:hypothetical protein